MNEHRKSFKEQKEKNILKKYCRTSVDDVQRVHKKAKKMAERAPDDET